MPPAHAINWEHEETITEYFTNEYTEKGVPEYLKKQGFFDVDLAAQHTASAYGCRVGQPKHFGANVIGIETDDYDGVSWWHCTVCGVAHSPWNPKKTTTEFKDDFDDQNISDFKFE